VLPDGLGTDHIPFGTHYPFEDMATATEFLAGAPIDEDDRAKVSHLNAERLQLVLDMSDGPFSISTRVWPAIAMLATLSFTNVRAAAISDGSLNRPPRVRRGGRSAEPRRRQGAPTWLCGQARHRVSPAPPPPGDDL
jgi:hypothetical protein